MNTKMEDYFCEYFEIDFRIPLEAFDKSAFLDDIKDISDVERQRHAWTFGSLTHPDKQHAHMYVDLRQGQQVRVRIVYHNVGLKTNDARPPYMEDCGQWLSKFIRVEEMSAELDASYSFNKEYSSVISLPFPLLTSRKELSGSQVLGISIRPPRRMKIEQAIIQKTKRGFTLHITTKIQVNLKTFDICSELEKLVGPVKSFFYKTGETL